MKKTFALALGLGLLAPALAFGQTGGAGVNSVPQPGLITGVNNQQATYTAGYIGLVPAASATDTVCIAGSATKTIAVTRIQLSGTAGTLVTLPVTLVRRTSVDTGGTAGSTTANPANTIAKHDTLSATATAVPISYTAVPTIVDTSPTYLQTANLTLPVTSAGTSIAPIDWRYGNIATGEQPLYLRGVAAQLCLNLNTISVSSGVLTGSITWYEF
jgi:hypothetical protein